MSGTLETMRIVLDRLAKRTSPRVTGGASAALAAFLFASSQAIAQSAIERHLPAQADVEPSSVSIGEQDFGKASKTPLGVDLAGIHLIGEAEAVANHPDGGLTGLAGVTVDAARLRGALGPFLGQPPSLAMARDIQAEIARIYREEGYPFVSVTLPPQEITRGVLQIRVIEFKSGAVRIKGVSPKEARLTRSNLRINRGERIDARALNEDLDWLNRSRYRRAEGVFRPGETAALSDLDVTVKEKKPWRVFFGWSNSGSEDTGRDRFFVGGNAGLPWLGGPWISYQATASSDIWSDPGMLVPRQGNYPSYLSHAGRLTIPTFARQSLEIAPALVASSAKLNQFFTIENTTFELPVIYRSAVSNILPGHYWGDAYGGLEFKRLERNTLFNGTSVAKGSAELFQLVLGWSDNFKDRLGQTAVDVRVKANPGGVVGGNDAATWQSFSNGRITDLSYAYLALDLNRATRLPGGLSWIASISGTLSGEPLPDTERISLGGRYAVRGYNYDDVSVDSGVIWRNELRLPSISLLGKWAGGGWLASIGDSISPYVFADLGFGKDYTAERSTTLGGLGVGFDYNVADTFTANFFAGVALSDAGRTQTGDLIVQAAITARL